MKQQQMFSKIDDCGYTSFANIPEKKKELTIGELERYERTLSPEEYGIIMRYLLSRDDFVNELLKTKGIGPKMIQGMQEGFASERIMKDLKELSEVGVRVDAPKILIQAWRGKIK